MLISRNSPFFTTQLGADFQARDKVAIQDTIAGFEKLGYAALDMGDQYAIKDFGDRTNLNSARGVKLAATIAPKIEALVAKLGYVK